MASSEDFSFERCRSASFSEGAGEYVCSLRPSLSSSLAHAFSEGRSRCRRAGLRPDATELYPPHITVTGFFAATTEQAAEVCALAEKELAARCRGKGSTEGDPRVVLSQVLATEASGYVLAAVHAPEVAAFADVLATSARVVGVQLRPKAVRHVSLASSRSSAEQAQIQGIYENLPVLGIGAWDFVVSRLVERSDVKQLEECGRAHRFQELLRVPVQAERLAPERRPPAPCTASFAAPAASAVAAAVATAVAAAATPLKRRLSAEARITPEKKVQRLALQACAFAQPTANSEPKSLPDALLPQACFLPQWRPPDMRA